MMLSRRQKHILLKFFSLFSVVRGYNILVVVLAQYLASIYIFAHDKPLKAVLLDVNLLMLVLASSATIAAGYIINSFYDAEKDLINRPQKTMIDRLVSQNTKLSFYFILNFLSVVFASYVSFRAVIFFALYIFAIWFYSHKLKKMPMVGNLVSAILAVTPFFAIFIYYANFEKVIFVHASFLFLLVSARELIKDLENLKGDLALNYQTIPVVYGEKTAKTMLYVVSIATIITALLLIQFFEIGRMYIFFYFSIVALVFFLFYVNYAKTKFHYIILHNLIKLIILLGVLSIVLIDAEMLIKKLI